MAVIGAISAPLIGASTANAASLSGPWLCIAIHESGNANLSYGDSTSTGYLQIQTPTWLDYGGGKYAPEAYMATEAQQFAIAEKILHGQGPGAWTTNSSYGCGLTSYTPDPFGIVIAPVQSAPPIVVAPPVAPTPVPKPKPVTPSKPMDAHQKHAAHLAHLHQLHLKHLALIAETED